MSQQHPSDAELELRRDTLLAAQVALLGELSCQVRAVTLSWADLKLHVRAIFDGEIDDDDRESIEVVATEILASLPEHGLEVECVRLDAPARFDTLFLTAWVYIRKERSQSP